MKTTQLILYNQLRSDFIQKDIDFFLYIHHAGKINFNWQELKLNTLSKIIDYAGGKQLIDELQSEWNTCEFLIEKKFIDGMLRFAKKHDVSKYIIVKPVENYVYENFCKIKKQLKNHNIELEFREDIYSFFLKKSEFQKQYDTPPIMEFFYRFMRKKYNIMMIGDKPEWGQWNYDKENRAFDRKHKKTWSFSLEVNEYVEEAADFYNYTLPNTFFQPTNRKQALLQLEYFIEKHLDQFGKLEDAMYEHDDFVHHSLLSTSINFWMLSPQEVVQKIVETNTAINNKEWFVRQILGWREYMYQYFQHYKDTIYSENYFDHTRKLPNYFRSDAEKCKMNCLSHSLASVQENHISHHIQRLMIIGNYALLWNYDPQELNRRFFEYYTDAFEWVVTPNVLAMSQYADGWKLATKPYIASANYINKMSDYCKSCHYDYKEKYGENACPYNMLYWTFVDDKQDEFQKWRQQFVLKNLWKINIEELQKQKEIFIKKQAHI